MTRSLTLRKETLTELAAGDLALVNGAATTTVTDRTRATLTFCPDFYCTGTI